MTDQGRQLVDAARLLADALTETSRALAAADLDGLLRSEERLELAVRRLSVPRALQPEDRAAVRDAFGDAARALVRCRRLGGALTEMVQLTLDAMGRSHGYRRPGAASPRYEGRSLDARG